MAAKKRSSRKDHRSVLFPSLQRFEYAGLVWYIRPLTGADLVRVNEEIEAAGHASEAATGQALMAAVLKASLCNPDGRPLFKPEENLMDAAGGHVQVLGARAMELSGLEVLEGTEKN